jgi:enoyl-CoA hydratase/carnithine racemase
LSVRPSRFTVAEHPSHVEVVFDDGGMNLLSSAALGELGSLVAGLSSLRHLDPSAVPQQPATRNQQPILFFRSSRPSLFAAGADMAEMARFSASEAEAFARLGQELFDAIERLPCVTIAIIDGDCFGGALDLSMSFDLRFATERSRFSHPGARLGIVTGFGGTSRWRKLLDRPAARRLFLGNEVFSAHDALAAGLIDGLGEPDLARLANRDPAVTRMLKDLAPRAERLDRRSLLLLAESLATLYAS